MNILLAVPAFLLLVITTGTSTAFAEVSPTTTTQTLPKVYDESADARLQIADALKRAKRQNQNVLIQWGGNWCGWCVKLHNLFTSDKTIAWKLSGEYQVVAIDTGKPDGKNVDLATSYGADLKRHGYPYLTILDADGKPLANQETASLEYKDQRTSSGHDAAMVMKFLTQNQPPFRPAQDLLDAALAEAKQSDKRVFLHFGGAPCRWCIKLDAWLDRADVAGILTKDFVVLKIDPSRSQGNEPVRSLIREPVYVRYDTDKPHGLPWIVFLDETGKMLVNCFGPKGSTGFPANEDEIAHFKSMLEQTAKRMTAEDIATLTRSLETP